MDNVIFLPRVGKGYLEGLTGHKVLVLGESHYCYDLGAGKCTGCSLENCIMLGWSRADYEQQTSEYIKDILYNSPGGSYQQTALSFERAVLGKEELTQVEREKFWNSVIFYNYIQKALPKKKGERTVFKSTDLIGADLAFKEVIEAYMPDRIIVWGCRLYGILPAWNGIGSFLKLPSGAKTDIWTYSIKGKSIPAMKVYHPSYPAGRDWQYWHKFYREFLK